MDHSFVFDRIFPCLVVQGATNFPSALSGHISSSEIYVESVIYRLDENGLNIYI